MVGLGIAYKTSFTQRILRCIKSEIFVALKTPVFESFLFVGKWCRQNGCWGNDLSRDCWVDYVLIY